VAGGVNHPYFLYDCWNNLETFDGSITVRAGHLKRRRPLAVRIDRTVRLLATCQPLNIVPDYHGVGFETGEPIHAVLI